MATSNFVIPPPLFLGVIHCLNNKNIPLKNLHRTHKNDSIIHISRKSDIEEKESA